MDDIPASTGLAPLASGVVEFVCDLKLDGMVAIVGDEI
jgi:hypothetical protein